jgi:hypothetical protein
MFRIAVVTYLMVAQVAGSLVCCCTVRPRATSPARAADAPAQQPAPDLPACCRKHLAQEQRHLPQDRPGKPQPGRPGCPCRQQAPGNAAVFFGSEATQHLQRDLSQGPVAVLPFLTDSCHSAAASSLGLGEAHALPFLTADDILDRLHILRC